MQLTNGPRCSALVLVILAGAAAPAWAQTSCVTCHSNADYFDADAIATTVGSFAEDVHAQVGLSCHDCHGGNPDAQLADDMDAAMDASFSSNPYRGALDRGDIPGFCGRCHSDPTYMKRYRPDARVDQEQEYWTSHHGQALRRGDLRGATCTDCHGAHGVRRASDPQAPVYPTRIGQTCAACHADPEHMRGSTLPDGSPVPVDQYARWQRSVHARAMFDKGDLTAPTCNDCHGNHGAAPPGLDSVAFVCGQCHGREASLFRASLKNDGFDRHNEFLADAGEDGCSACHEPPEPAATLTGIRSFTECTTCHGNHSIVRPTVALLSPLPDTPCAFCHESPELDLIPEPETTVKSYSETLSALLDEPAAQVLDDEELFDWLVDRALELPTHTLAESSEEGPILRPEFSRLFEKFRIGKIHYSFRDPATGEEVIDRVKRCTDCHAAEPQLAEFPVGVTSATAALQHMQALTGATARAERMLLRAKRGGVEVREALLDLDQAIDSQIELEVLVHEFSGEAGETFKETHAEGLEHARGALAAAQSGLDELLMRRRGLGLSLIFVVLVLVGLGLRIRQTSAS